MTDSKPYLSDVPPTYMGNLMKMIPLFREFNGQKPTHMGGTYPYQQYVMYLLPGGVHSVLMDRDDDYFTVFTTAM